MNKHHPAGSKLLLWVVAVEEDEETGCREEMEVEREEIFHFNVTYASKQRGHSSRFPAPGPCEVCLQGKQSRQPFLNMTEERKAKRILETISSDICGPITPSTFD
ncbi:hypothetical protein QE152_g34306 [Popillia japonica]|uniref:Uncharacterized protein n=1 Tax=Popillia japonica TaxID=7064 RepID=A0AAW1ITD8_POPJA